jgi:hypothetical protein
MGPGGAGGRRQVAGGRWQVEGGPPPELRSWSLVSGLAGCVLAAVLAAGCWLLLAAGCCWLLAAAGCWLLLAAGCCWLLAAAGCWPLALFVGAKPAC